MLCVPAERSLQGKKKWKTTNDRCEPPGPDVERGGKVSGWGN